MPAARTADPGTSKVAARTAHNPTEVQQRILQILRALTFFERSVGLSDEQIHTRYQQLATERGWVMPTAQSIRSRRVELQRAGQVAPTGRFGETESHRKTQLWKATS
jgi:hypothetical protein